MNLFVPFLMLSVPGIIAVSIHDKRLINITRENWQSVMWKYLIYSFFIVFVTNFAMFLSCPDRTVSYSPWVVWTTSHIFASSFVAKYTILAVAASFCLPRLWYRRDKIVDTIKKRKSFKILDDE